MPTTVTAALVIVLATLPGLLGDWIFRSAIGINWRETEWKGILRLVAFSTAGATLFGVASALFRWPSLIHLIPRTYDEIQQSSRDINDIFLPYAGHVIGGAIAGIIAVLSARILSKFSPRSPFPTAWDDFIRTYLAERWAIVGLQNGDVYAGRIVNADLSVPATERDIVLAEPCLFDPSLKAYVALNYQHMFLQAANIYSIASVYEKSKDGNRRLVPVDEPLFMESPKDAKRETHAATTTESPRGGGQTRLETTTTDSEATGSGTTTATNAEKDMSVGQASPIRPTPRRPKSSKNRRP